MTGYNRDAWTEFVESTTSAGTIRELEDFQPDVIKLAKLCGWRRILHIRDSRQVRGRGVPRTY